MDFIDHFIGLAGPNNDDIAKRNSIVNEWWSICAVQIYNNSLQIETGSNRLRICDKETLKNNPALYTSLGWSY